MENEYLLDYIGRSQTPKVKDDILKYCIEKKNKFCGFDGYNLPMSVISVTPPGDNEIKSLGASVLSDLILNNFGLWITGVLGMRGGTSSFTNESGGAETVELVGGGSNQFNCAQDSDASKNPSTGSYFRLGSSAVAPTRNDFKINTLLGSTPESSLQATGDGLYSSILGRAIISRAFPGASGSDTVREMGLFYRLANTSLDGDNYMVTHDLVSPVVAYDPGEIINVELIWNF